LAEYYKEDQTREDEMDGACTCMDKKGNNTKLWFYNLKESYPLEEPDLYERVILSWILKKYCGTVWIGLIWLRTDR
jgi:hypothetical protein